MRKLNQVVCLAAASVLGASAASHAASLATFTASPISSNLPELVWTNEAIPQLVAGPGSIGNADGLLPVALQTAGGLGVQTPLSIIAPGSSPQVGGGTSLSDCTLVLSGFRANAPAVDPGSGIILQTFGQSGDGPLGAFSVFSTDPDGIGPIQPTLLLSGTVRRGTITALDGATSASVLSGQVTYTGGLILDALSGGTITTGSLSWSLLDAFNTVSGDPSITIDPATGYLASFGANATGLFSTPAIPEPATTSLMAVSALGLMVRRRRAARA